MSQERLKGLEPQGAPASLTTAEVGRRGGRRWLASLGVCFCSRQCDTEFVKATAELS